MKISNTFVRLAALTVMVGGIASSQALADSGTAAAVLKAAGTVLTGQQPVTLGPAQTGQPNQTCGSDTAPNTPGKAASAPGSAFNPDGTAGTVYAGEQPQNSKNSASVSQYDVACFHQPL